MLHPLSPTVLGPSETKPLFHEYVANAYEWVTTEHARHAATGDEKLRRRYRRLLGYFHASGVGPLVEKADDGQKMGGHHEPT